MVALRSGIAGLLLAAVLVACASAPGRAPGRAGTPLTLRVMSFNIEWGGTHVSFDNVVEAIRRAEADVVGIQEAEGNLERLATALDWHFDRRTYVVSRYPVIDPPGAAGQYVYVEVRPSHVIAIANVHLPSDPYGPYAVRDGATPAAVRKLELATRMPSIQKTLAALEPLLSRDLPLFVTGDFNAPAHTDWTAAVAASRASVPYALAWPVSRAMTDAGFRDSWRDVHPDPVAEPGFTWWAGRPPIPRYVLSDDEPHDRIDFVWFAGPATPRDSTLVGESDAPGVAIGLSPWPSDHRAVVSEFVLEPAPVPDLVTTDRRVYREPQAIGLVHYLHADVSARLCVTRTGEASCRALQRDVEGNGRLTLAPGALPPGPYVLDAALSDGRTPPPREFWVLPAEATPSVGVSGDRFERGMPIDIAWRNGPGHRNDYLAIYPQGESPAEDADPIWLYLDARPEGRIRLDATSARHHWPLAPGRYVAWLVKDDGYEPLAHSTVFEIR